MCSSPMEDQWKFPRGRGRGVSKTKVLKEKYGVKLEFPEGWDGGCKAKQKLVCVCVCVCGGGGMYIFWIHTIPFNILVNEPLYESTNRK